MKNVQSCLSKAHYLVDIGGHVGGIPMQVEQRLRTRVIGGNPPTCKLAASERKPDVLKSYAQVGRRAIDDRARVENEPRLCVPDASDDDEVQTGNSGNDYAAYTKRQRSLPWLHPGRTAWNRLIPS